MSKQINIGGRLHSTEQGNVITGANEVLDDTKGKKQNVINADVDAELLRLDQSKQNNLTFDNTPTENSNNPVKSSGVYAADKALSDAIDAILILIPSAATALNQLADKNFVNSSIATDTATFRGTSETGLSEAQFLEWANGLTHDMNDYVFWQTIDEAGNTLFKRYKWNGTQWLYEYTLNNSSFTADQWAAIMSGITSALVEKLNGLPTNAALQQALNSKQDNLTFDNVPTEGSNNPVKSGGVYSAVKAEEDARLNLAQTVNGIGGDVSQIEDVIPAGATAQNKLVANASMEAYVASIIQNITASFTLSTGDGHINLTLTQVNGQVATLTLTSSDIASDQALTALTGRVTTAEGNINSLTGRVSTNETDIANLQQLYNDLQQLYNDLQQSKPVPVTALPETGQQQGVIYRLAGTTSYSDYMWNGSSWVLMATYNNAIDSRPKKASQNLVTSGGVFDNIGALDVSELNATENPHALAKYADLSAALAAIPTDYQNGGMSIKFVQSSDNKYVQYRLVSDTFNTTLSNWQGVDDIIEKSYLGANLFYGTKQQILNYDVVSINNSNVEFTNNIKVGDTIQFETTPYRKVIQINVSNLFGFVTTTHASDSLAFVITDINDKILYTQTGASNDYDNPGFVNISVSKEAYYLYIQCFPQDNPVVTLHEDTPFSSPIFKRTCNELEGNPNIIEYYSALQFVLSDDNVVGDKIKFGQNNYSVVGKLDIDGRTDKIHFDKLMAMSDTTIWIITDDKNNIIDISRNGVVSTNVACDILLGKYSKRAKYLYFNFGIGSSNIPTITSLGTDLINEELPIYIAYQYYKFKEGLSIGDTFDIESTPYLRVFGIDVFDQKGQITIVSTVDSNDGDYAIIVDKNEKVLDIITATPTHGEFYATTFVDLDKYPNSYKVYFSAHPDTTYFPYPSATLTCKSIKSKIYESHLGNNAATLLLHFDGTEGTDNYVTYRKSILDEYGFKASFIIAPSCFVDSDFSKPWITEELETQFWNLIRDGWDAMLYPSTVSSTYDEEGWKNWMSNALNGLAAKGIFNITCWAAGNLEINDDILNACKANHFKILRGGKGTYPYNVDNWYMPQIPNSANNPIINRAFFVNYQSKLNYVKTYIDYLCASKTAGSLFTHLVLETTSDTNNIDTALFRQILDYIKTKVDSGELIIKTFSEYYASVNPSDGMEWNYNRLLKMQLFNNQ